MKETLQEFIQYAKNPVLQKDENLSINNVLKYFTHLLFFCIAAGLLSTPLFVLFEDLGWISMENHKVEALFEGMSLFKIILIGGFIGPMIEELMFRAPMTLFKSPSSFRIAFYVLTILFGLIHITNFDLTLTVLLLSPFLVIPQLFTGFALGFLRVRFGLVWAILLHCTYNSFLLIISSIFDL